jgi:hypothetical protein
MEIKGENYVIAYDPTTATVTFQGTLRLQDMIEYSRILQLLDEVAVRKPETITLDLGKLRFLNSSGFSVLSRFVIKIREQNTSKIILRGSEEVYWQQKSLRSLQRLMKELRTEWI